MVIYAGAGALSIYDSTEKTQPRQEVDSELLSNR